MVGSVSTCHGRQRPLLNADHCPPEETYLDDIDRYSTKCTHACTVLVNARLGCRWCWVSNQDRVITTKTMFSQKHDQERKCSHPCFCCRASPVPFSEATFDWWPRQTHGTRDGAWNVRLQTGTAKRPPPAGRAAIRGPQDAQLLSPRVWAIHAQSTFSVHRQATLPGVHRGS